MKKRTPTFIENDAGKMTPRNRKAKRMAMKLAAPRKLRFTRKEIRRQHLKRRGILIWNHF